MSANNLQRLFKSQARPVSVVERDGGNTAVTFTGAATFTPFPAQQCASLTVANNSGVTVEVQQDGQGEAFPIFTGTSFKFGGIDDAARLAVRRADLAATSTKVSGRWGS